MHSSNICRSQHLQEKGHLIRHVHLSLNFLQQEKGHPVVVLQGPVEHRPGTHSLHQVKVKGHQALRASVKHRRLRPGTRSLKQVKGPHLVFQAPVKHRPLRPVKEQQPQHALLLHCRLQTPHPPQFLISREHP
ncbi:unnamed protein product [Gadus morhua 'NCC']